MEFDFPRTQYFEVQRVEMVVFNCVQWGISVRTIILEAGGSLARTINPTATSCDSLVRVCIPNVFTTETELILIFITINDDDWVHIAEVTFYGNSPNCPPDTIITTPTPATTTGKYYIVT